MSESKFDALLGDLVDSENKLRMARAVGKFRDRFGAQLAEFASGIVGSDDVRIDGVRMSPEGEQWRRVQPCMDCKQDDWLMTNVRAHNATSLRALIDAEIKTTCPECMRRHNERVQAARFVEVSPPRRASLIRRAIEWLKEL